MDICAVCAWRETCQKKFSISGKDVRCPDFAKDVTIKDSAEKDTEGKKSDTRLATEKEGRCDIQ